MRLLEDTLRVEPRFHTNKTATVSRGLVRLRRIIAGTGELATPSPEIAVFEEPLRRSIIPHLEQLTLLPVVRILGLL